MFRVMVPGFPPAFPRTHALRYFGRARLSGGSLIEARYPGSLLNNCSYELWEKRYVSGNYAQVGDEQQRQVMQRARADPPLAFA